MKKEISRKKIEKFYEKVVIPGLRSEVKGKYHDVEGSDDSPPFGFYGER